MMVAVRLMVPVNPKTPEAVMFTLVEDPLDSWIEVGVLPIERSVTLKVIIKSRGKHTHPPPTTCIV